MPAESRPRSSSPYAVEQVAVTVHRSVLGAWWRWRTELTATVILSGSFLEGWRVSGWWLWPLIVLAALVLVLGLVPAPRRSFLLARFRVLFTRHRLQRAFWELRLHTRAGRLPLIPWITATPAGVRAWVLIRAGMTAEDFEDSAAAFATACGARECRVTVSPQRAWLLSVDVIYRDVLGPARVIGSPLTAFPVGPVAVPARSMPALTED